MAKKRFTTDLVIKADTAYTCNISKSYTEVFRMHQELDNSDGFITIVAAGIAKSTPTKSTPTCSLGIELGAHVGLTTSLLATHCKQVWAVEHSKAVLETNMQRNSKHSGWFS